MKIYDFSPSNIPDKILIAIGRVALSSAQTESVLGDFIGTLLNIDLIESHVLTKDMSASTKIKNIRELIELNAAHAGIVDEVDELVDKIEEALKQRNTLLHSSIGVDEETYETFLLKSKSKKNSIGEVIKITPSEILKVAEEIEDSGLKLVAFMANNSLLPKDRRVPLRAPLKRNKSARTERSNTKK